MIRVAAVVEQSWHAVPGGTATATNSQLAALASLETGPELVGVAAYHRHPPEPDVAPPIAVRHHRLPRRALYASWLWARRPRVEALCGEIDVVHATSAAIPGRSAPLIVTVHDLAFLRFPEHASSMGQRFFLRSWDITTREADLILCPSQATADDCVDNGVSVERIRVVPWGVERSPVTESEVREVRERFGLPEQFVLFVGTVEPRKNLRRLVEAMVELGPHAPPLVVAGPAGWDDDIATITQPLGERALTLGYVSSADLPVVYSSATVFAYPSLSEGFGLPVLEAMAQGVPVVTSAGTATQEVGGSAALCVDPRSVTAIADAVGGLLDSAGARDRQAAAGRARAADFTWQRSAELTAAAYREVAR